MKTATLKSSYISLIIVPRSLPFETNFQEIMSTGSSDVVRFDIGTVFPDETNITKLKNAYNSLIIAPRSFGCETNL